MWMLVLSCKMTLKSMKWVIIDVPERIHCGFRSQAIVRPRSLRSRAYRGRTLRLSLIQCTRSDTQLLNRVYAKMS